MGGGIISAMGMTHQGRRILAFWVGAYVIGGVLTAALGVILLPVLEDQVRVHVLDINTSNWVYLTVRVVIAVLSTVAVAGPAAYVLGRWLYGIGPTWIAASAVAGLVAFSIPTNTLLAAGNGYLMQAPEQPSLVVAPFISGVTAGCIFGLAQAIVLQPYIRAAAWWIPVSSVAWSVARVATSIVTWQIAGAGIRFTTPNDFYAEEIVGPLLTSLVIGVVTGLALVRLLGESNREMTETAH